VSHGGSSGIFFVLIKFLSLMFLVHPVDEYNTPQDKT